MEAGLGDKSILEAPLASVISETLGFRDKASFHTKKQGSLVTIFK